MPHAPSPHGWKDWGIAVGLVIALAFALAGPGARASAAGADPDDRNTGVSSSQSGQASTFVDARDAYERARAQYRAAEYAGALAETDGAIRALNSVLTRSDDASVRRAAGDLLRRVASLRLSCTREIEKEKQQLHMVGPPSPTLGAAPGQQAATPPHSPTRGQAPPSSDPPLPARGPSGPEEAYPALGGGAEPPAEPGGGEALGPAAEPVSDGDAGSGTAPATPDIELVHNNQVQKWIDFYTGRGRGTFERWLKRSGLYIEWMKGILHSEGLPTDLVHLVFVESGFNPDARSRSHAVGPWQFIRGTAKLFGLKIDRWIDERKDPERATVAAARYLKHLYALFESWPLALASYNAGEGTVLRAVSRQGTKDFWQLRLPQQTREYVPQFLACLRIAREPERFGFAGVERESPLEFDTVQIPGPVDLKAAAAACGASLEALRKLNPAVLRHAAPTDPVGLVTLRVPAGSGQGLLAGLQSGSVSLPEVKTPADPPYVRHKVGRGETLSTIARRYGIRLSELAAANGLSTKARVRRGRTLRVPSDAAANVAYFPARAPVATSSAAGRADGAPPTGGAKETAGGPAKEARAASGKGEAPVYGGTRTVRIRPGDTLSGIAQRYGTDVRTLRALNGLRPRQSIKAGAKLKVPVTSEG